MFVPKTDTVLYCMWLQNASWLNNIILYHIGSGEIEEISACQQHNDGTLHGYMGAKICGGIR